MKYATFPYRLGAALAVVAALVSGPARADLVLLGSDYFETVQPTFFVPLGPANPLTGLAMGPGTTDTIVQRQADCGISLVTAGSSCTIPIELVALSLVSTVNPLVRVRESPTLASAGTMTMTSNGSGSGGTFNSFFDVFFELSFDGGNTFVPGGDLILQSSNTDWTTQEHGLLVDGLVGDQDANRHTDKGTAACPIFGNGDCVDFYLGNGAVGGFDTVTECHPGGVGCHSAMPAQIPEPGSLALFGLALAALALLRGQPASAASISAKVRAISKV